MSVLYSVEIKGDIASRLNKDKLGITFADDAEEYVLTNYPGIYVMTWPEDDTYGIYVGESNNVIDRLRQHFDAANKKDAWQKVLKAHEKDLTIYIMGHKHFHKSITLDLEDRLINYITGIGGVNNYNSRGNSQGKYYMCEEADDFFHKIWRKLRKYNKDLFPSEANVKNSAIFKASPFHKLTEDQEEAKNKIIAKVMEALDKKEKGQLVFVEGCAGTGKTVLNSNMFSDFCADSDDEEDEDTEDGVPGREISCKLLVNHDEQIAVYSQIADKLGITKKRGKVVEKPTPFIYPHAKPRPSDDIVDVVFIDEAHLLLTQGKQAYRGKNQLEDILKYARVVVAMFDKRQILTAKQYIEEARIEAYRRIAKKNGTYIELKEQLRMQSGPELVKWIDKIIDGRIDKLPENLGRYEVKVFDSPEELEKAIRAKADKEESKLSRIIATYDWPYNQKKKPAGKKFWEVEIGDWSQPWNRELEKEFNKLEKREIKNLVWAEQPKTIGEVGSTFTIQGFDLSYAGLIIRPSVAFRNGKVIFLPENSKNAKATRNRTLSNGTKKNFGEVFIKNELNILMKRGVNGLYLYACDAQLQKKLKRAVGK